MDFREEIAILEAHAANLRKLAHMLDRGHQIREANAIADGIDAQVASMKEKLGIGDDGDHDEGGGG